MPAKLSLIVLTLLAIAAQSLCANNDMTLDSAISAVDVKKIRGQIDAVVGTIMKSDPKSWTAAKRNAAAEGLYMLYEAEHTDARLKQLREGVRALCDSLPENEPPPARAFVLAAQFDVLDRDQKAISAAFPEDDNVLWQLVTINRRMGDGQIEAARGIALGMHAWKRFSLEESTGLSDLLSSYEQINGLGEDEAALALWANYQRTSLVMSRLFVDRLMFSLQQSYHRIADKESEHFALVSLRMRLVGSLLRETHLIGEANNGYMFALDMESTVKYEAPVFSASDAQSVTEAVAKLSATGEEVRDLNGKWLFVITHSTDAKLLTKAIRQGQDAVLGDEPTK